ncbi:hypothetical protein NIES37_02800 [Tolypothrix tenuis PCC 7101]|uniref:Uncharacterized protein n=1 Tax=Tolypothrix tenuis PCC 7101 TaxID=231146 RepID=A0A1Z4MSB8_9CYAN|nr:hypothetical protein [Aulosira sp. FACHB-113]BAY31833.1 hypothetical protein NIES2107_37190 [Nostoc carneum NIES-2107]BAY96348.1 hypothetical protein NIES37_02800 [Tolypothrix tenuis PCC 7101]BAZ73145.1 hypothetical protein NIES50_17040 [Aulosira laxa NIES-50]
MLYLIVALIHGIQALLVPICFVVAWAVMILGGWSLWSAARDSVSKAKQMHQIPCTGCQFFTDNYRLKCTVHPSIANTEEAIHCHDFQAKTNSMYY